MYLTTSLKDPFIASIHDNYEIRVWTDEKVTYGTIHVFKSIIIKSCIQKWKKYEKS